MQTCEKADRAGGLEWSLRRAVKEFRERKVQRTTFIHFLREERGQEWRNMLALRGWGFKLLLTCKGWGCWYVATRLLGALNTGF